MLNNKRHYDRLKEKNIVIESIYSKSNKIKFKTEKLIRSSDGLRNDTINYAPLIEKRYFYKNECIFVENELNQNFNYTFKNIPKYQNLECPNCGYEGPIKFFYDGCPYCGTDFNIDFKIKKLDVSKIRNDLSEKPAWILVIGITVIILILNMIFSDVKMPYLLLYLTFIPHCFICSLLVSSFIYFFLIFPIQIIKEKIDAGYKIKKNQIPIIEDLNFALHNYYYNNSNYNDMIDFNIIKYYSILPINKNNIKIKYKIIQYYLFDGKITKIRKKQQVILKRNEIKEKLNVHNVKKCINCGSDIDLLGSRCEYCSTPIPKINNWLLERIVD